MFVYPVRADRTSFSKLLLKQGAPMPGRHGQKINILKYKIDNVLRSLIFS